MSTTETVTLPRKTVADLRDEIASTMEGIINDAGDNIYDSEYALETLHSLHAALDDLDSALGNPRDEGYDPFESMWIDLMTADNDDDICQCPDNPSRAR